MRLSDLKEHEESHTNELLECPVEGCIYTAKLKRYIRIHLRQLTQKTMNCHTRANIVNKALSSMNRGRGITQTIILKHINITPQL